jgi:hypothetical protein
MTEDHPLDRVIREWITGKPAGVTRGSAGGEASLDVFRRRSRTS